MSKILFDKLSRAQKRPTIIAQLFTVEQLGDGNFRINALNGLAIRGMPGSEFEPRRPLQIAPSEKMVLSACQKSLFDKLRAVFQNLKSSEKPVIANERHP